MLKNSCILSVDLRIVTMKDSKTTDKSAQILFYYYYCYYGDCRHDCFREHLQKAIFTKMSAYLYTHTHTYIYILYI